MWGITCGSMGRRFIIGSSFKNNSFSLDEKSILFDNVNIGRNVMIKKTIIAEKVKIPTGSNMI
jgi:glucose-1-phosphate adenylyltransferase